MKPIWYFVGWMFVVIGALVVIAGFYNLVSAPSHPTMMDSLHPDIWWGGLITIVGIFYVWKHKNLVIE